MDPGWRRAWTRRRARGTGGGRGGGARRRRGRGCRRGGRRGWAPRGGGRSPWRPTTPTRSCRKQHRSHPRHHRRLPPIETELIRQREAKRGSSKTEAQDKALNLLRVREDLQKAIDGENYVGFDEYMNLVLDDAEEINVKKSTRKSLGHLQGPCHCAHLYQVSAFDQRYEKIWM